MSGSPSKASKAESESSSRRVSLGLNATVNRDLCAQCKLAGELLLCDTCPRSYHAECATQVLEARDPSKKKFKHAADINEDDDWICPRCKIMEEEGEVEVDDAYKFSMVVDEKQALGSGVILGRLLQHFEMSLRPNLFRRVFEIVREPALKVARKQTDGAPRSTVSLQIAMIMQQIATIVGEKVLLKALKACEEGSPLGAGMGTMGGEQPCYNPSCESYNGFRVLRTKCLTCGSDALDSRTFLPKSKLLDFSPGPLLNEVRWKEKDLGGERMTAADRGLDYFIQVAKEPRMAGVGDVVFLGYKLWGALRGSPLEHKACKMVEDLCEDFLQREMPTMDDAEDLPALLDMTEGIHVLARILDRSEDDEEQPKLTNKKLAANVVREHRDQVESLLLEFDISDIAGFDPSQLRPPFTPPHHCSNCGQVNSKHLTVCARCAHYLIPKFDFGSMTDALVWCFVFNSIGLEAQCQTSGKRRANLTAGDVMLLLPAARKYRDLDELGEDFWKLECYFVTHFIYVISDWGEVSLRRDLYTEEFRFITSSLTLAVRLDDPEIVGEFIHCLAIFGYNDQDEATNKAIPGLKEAFLNAIRFLLSTEKHLGKIGTWTAKSSVTYARYHAAWCGVVGLLPHKAKKGEPCAYVSQLEEPYPKFQ